MKNTVLVTVALLIGYGLNWSTSTNSPAFKVRHTAAQETDPAELTFQWVRQRTFPGNLHRAKVPGGWLVGLVPSRSQQSTALAFIPDPGHGWDGTSLKAAKQSGVLHHLKQGDIVLYREGGLEVWPSTEIPPGLFEVQSIGHDHVVLQGNPQSDGSIPTTVIAAPSIHQVTRIETESEKTGN